MRNLENYYMIPDWKFWEDEITEGKQYPILNIRYTKYCPEGLVTTITDNHKLKEYSAKAFQFFAKEK